MLRPISLRVLLSVPCPCHSSGDVFSFTIARNPWTRARRRTARVAQCHSPPRGGQHAQVLSAYVGKVADDTQAKAPRVSLARIRAWYGLDGAAPVSFSQFVRWLGKDTSDDNAHWRPHSRQCAPGSLPYSLIGRTETLGADLRLLVRTLGLPDSLVVAEHISTSSSCRRSARCAAALSRQAGPGWAALSSDELLTRMYRSDSAHDLRSVVRRAFAADVKAQNYTFPVGKSKQKDSARRTV